MSLQSTSFAFIHWRTASLRTSVEKRRRSRVARLARRRARDARASDDDQTPQTHDCDAHESARAQALAHAFAHARESAELGYSPGARPGVALAAEDQAICAYADLIATSSAFADVNANDFEKLSDASEMPREATTRKRRTRAREFVDVLDALFRGAHVTNAKE